MKIIKLFIIFLSLSVLSACVDTEEYIVINADNSGTYTYTMDLGKMIGMINQMGSEDNKEGKPDEMDSIINLKDLVSASENLTAAEKELYKDATVRIKVDKKNAEMKVIMFCPFKSINQLPEIKDSLFLVLNKIKAFEKISGKEEDVANSENEDKNSQKALTPASGYYKFTAGPDMIENSVIDPPGIKNTLSSDSTIMMMQQMIGMVGDPKYKTTITSFKEIKSYTGNGALFSPDKRSVTFTTTFSEMLEKPDKLSYKIEY